MTKIDDLIARGELLGENWWAADADDIGTFSAAAANAREDIKAMWEENKRLREACRIVIGFNVQEAIDRYADSSKAENWSCVKVLREALGGARYE